MLCSPPAGWSNPTPPVAIALGSNIGDRAAHLAFGVSRLAPVIHHLKQSSWSDTAPVGVADQPRFLNGVVIGDTALSARSLLDVLLGIEREAGRERPFAGAPRTLDLDLILYGNERISEAGLIVPHPRFRERLFVLEPLAELAPTWVDPESGTAISALLQALLARRPS